MANYIESDREFALKLQEEEDSIANDSLLASQLQSQYDEETRRSPSVPSETRSSQEDLHDDMDIHVDEMSQSSSTRRNLRSQNRRTNRRPEPRLVQSILGDTFISFFQGPHHFHDMDSDDDEDDYEALLELAENVGEAVPKGLKSHEINALPISTFHSNANGAPRWYSTHKEDHSCAICLSEFEENEELRTLPCLHRFHVTCIDRWIKTNGVCPTCRVEIKEQLENGS